MKLISRALKYEKDLLRVLDQTLLPGEEKWLTVDHPHAMIEMIKALKVRGAPLIGVAAALSLGDWVQKHQPSRDEFLKTAGLVRESRPTAINLMNAVDRLVDVVETDSSTSMVFEEALQIFKEDVALCDKMSRRAAEFIESGDHVLTHCNTGGLATVGRGTALGAISAAWEDKKKIHVFVDETRPLLQGARLTAWELAAQKIPYTLICDNMAGALMAQGRVQKVFVGTDRIALNGDFANKVGTYPLAVLCHYHKVPFYVVAPWTTVDPHCLRGKDIPVEERKPSEVQGVEGSFGRVQWSPQGAPVFNPAFDVTPVDLVTGIIVDGDYYSQADLKNHKLYEKYKA